MTLGPVLRSVLGSALSPALGEGMGSIIRSIFADGTDGFYFNFSELDEMFTGSQGPTNVAVATDAIGLALDDHSWGPRSLASQLAQATELVSNPGGPFTATTGWTANGATLSVDSGNLRITSTGAGFIGQASATMTTVVGKTYAVRFTSLGGTGGIGTLRIGTSAGGTQIGTFAPGTGTWTYYFVATATTTYLTLCASSTNGQYVDYSICSGKLLDGNHGLQATAAAQPKWQTGGLARFDGTDDYLSTPLQLGTAGSMVVKFNKAVGNSSQAIMGQRVGSGDDAILILNSSGLVVGNVGTGANLSGVVNRAGANVVAALTWDGATVNLYENGVLIGTQAQSGAVAAANVLIGSALTASLFAAVDIYHALAIKKALTAADIAAITSQWGTS